MSSSSSKRKFSSAHAFTIGRLYRELCNMHVLLDDGKLLWANEFNYDMVQLCKEVRDGDMIAMLSAAKLPDLLNEMEHRKVYGVCVCGPFNPSTSVMHRTGTFARAIFATARYLQDNANRQISTPSACILYDFRSRAKSPAMMISVGQYDMNTRAKALAKATTMACTTFHQTTQELNDTSGQTKRFTQRNKQHMNVLLSNGKGRQEVKTPYSILNAVQRAHGHFDDPVPVNPRFNALDMRWANNNYVNPPFSCTLAFVIKAIKEADENGSSSTILMPCSPSTVAFQEILRTPHCKHVGFIRGQVKFKDFKKALPVPLCLVRIEPKARDLTKSQGPHVMWVDLEPEIRRSNVPLDAHNIYIPNKSRKRSRSPPAKEETNNKRRMVTAEEILLQKVD